MSRRTRIPSGGEDRREDWLRRGLPPRQRPWALQEHLLASISDESRSKVLGVLAADLAHEQAELTGMEEALHGQALRIARLEGRLNVLLGRVGGDLTESIREHPRAERPIIEPHSARTSLKRDYWLCRCEGFSVDSPTRRIGVVEGLRFLSRIDQPDLLEVRAGLFGRQLLLIPIEEVEDILFAEGRLILRDTPLLHRAHLHELLVRLHKGRMPATS